MKGFDCDQKLTAASAAAFKKAGFDFVIRYVGREIMDVTKDIDAAELKICLNAGLDVGLVQHAALPGWIPSAALGAEYGANAAKFAKQVGYAAGCSIFNDMESPKAGTLKQAIVDFENAWFAAVNPSYKASDYIGCSLPMTGDDLYKLFKTHDYWKSLSAVPDVTTRGYEMIQQAGGTLAGIQYDIDYVIGDRLSNLPLFMKATQPKIVLHNIQIFNDGSYSLN